ERFGKPEQSYILALLGFIRLTKRIGGYEHGRNRADQSAFRNELLGVRARPPFIWQARQYADALPLLAALTPPEHKISLIDENVEDIDFDLCTMLSKKDLRNGLNDDSC